MSNIELLVPRFKVLATELLYPEDATGKDVEEFIENVVHKQGPECFYVWLEKMERLVANLDRVGLRNQNCLYKKDD